MKYLRIQFSLLIVSVCLIAMVLGFAGAIDTASFKKSYTESLVASYSVAGTEPVRKIEYAIKYGKSLTNFYGINELLLETQNDFHEILDIRIILPNGKVTYSLSGNKEDNKITEDIKKAAFSKESFTNGKNYIITENKYNILIPIMDKQKVQIGILDMVLDKSVISSKVTSYFNKIMLFLLVIVAISIVFIGILFYFIPVIKTNGEIEIKRVALMLISVLGVAQLAFGVLNYNFYKKIYVETSKENTAMVLSVVQRDMNFVIQKGVPISELNGIESWLNSIVQYVPEIESLYITNITGEILYKNPNFILNQKELMDSTYNYRLSLREDNLLQNGFVNLVLSKNYIEKKLKDIALDTFTVVLISFIFMTEVINTLILILKRKKNSSDDDKLTELKMIRPIAFVFIFAYSLTTSFIPIVMRGFNSSLMWMPESLKLSLPISLEAFGSVVSTIITGHIIHKKGWKPPFFYGIIISCAGSVLSGISSDGTMFILARLITGVGYGFSWMAVRGYVSTFDLSAQAKGFSSLNSGIMSGLNCGIVLGAMIAERSGYSMLFFLTGGLLVISLVVSYLLVKNKKEVISIKNIHSPVKQSVFKIAFNAKVIAFVLLILVPSSICSVFLTYLFPIISIDMGITSTNVGRVFLMYGVLIVYLGPLFGKYVGSKISIKKSVLISNLFYALAVLIFAVYMNAIAAVVAVLLLGFSSSFGLVAQSSYFLSLDISKNVGSSISLAAYSVFYKLGQMIGPLIFGLMTTLGISVGTKIIGIVTIILMIIYMMLNIKTINKHKGV